MLMIFSLSLNFLLIRHTLIGTSFELIECNSEFMNCLLRNDLPVNKCKTELLNVS